MMPLPYQRRFGRIPYTETISLDCELFLDRGKGFNEAEKLIQVLELEDGRGAIRYDLCRFSEGLSRIRFDPGNEAIAFERITARYQDGESVWHELNPADSSVLDTDDNLLLFGADPWIEFVLPSSIAHVLEIEVQVSAMGHALIGILVEHLRSMAGLRAELETHKRAETKLWSDLAGKDRDLAMLQHTISRLSTSTKVEQ
jgi:hypothetical protein